jgi:hypothetical protein
MGRRFLCASRLGRAPVCAARSVSGAKAQSRHDPGRAKEEAGTASAPHGALGVIRRGCSSAPSRVYSTRGVGRRSAEEPRAQALGKPEEIGYAKCSRISRAGYVTGLRILSPAGSVWPTIGDKVVVVGRPERGVHLATQAAGGRGWSSPHTRLDSAERHRGARARHRGAQVPADIEAGQCKRLADTAISATAASTSSSPAYRRKLRSIESADLGWRSPLASAWPERSPRGKSPHMKAQPGRSSTSIRR